MGRGEFLSCFIFSPVKGYCNFSAFESSETIQTRKKRVYLYVTQEPHHEKSCWSPLIRPVCALHGPGPPCKTQAVKFHVVSIYVMSKHAAAYRKVSKFSDT